jgi:hypothetical protein
MRYSLQPGGGNRLSTQCTSELPAGIQARQRRFDARKLLAGTHTDSFEHFVIFQLQGAIRRIGAQRRVGSREVTLHAIYSLRQLGAHPLQNFPEVSHG